MIVLHVQSFFLPYNIHFSVLYGMWNKNMLKQNLYVTQTSKNTFQPNVVQFNPEDLYVLTSTLSPKL